MELNKIKELIASVRFAHGNNTALIADFCDEVTLLIQENQRLNAEKEELYRESALRQRTIDQMKTSGIAANNNQQVLEQMIADLRGLANPQNPTVPPLSTACLRQHAAMSALNGLLAEGTATGAAPKMAVRLADDLVKELSK